tara:strand:+ start:223 stop:513 length:291 start_codon:yes stop_codon:yes gene_type:complete
MQKNKWNEVYVRCQYREGMFDDEANVQVGSSESWIFVGKEDTVELEDGGHGIKVYSANNLTPKKGEISVWVNDWGDHRLTRRNVAIDDIIKGVVAR